jgi:hypothetical protein
MKNSQKGFGHVAIILVLLVVLIITGVGYFVYQKDNGSTAAANKFITAVRNGDEKTVTTLLDTQSPDWQFLGVVSFNNGYSETKATASYVKACQIGPPCEEYFSQKFLSKTTVKTSSYYDSRDYLTYNKVSYSEAGNGGQNVLSIYTYKNKNHWLIEFVSFSGPGFTPQENKNPIQPNIP